MIVEQDIFNCLFLCFCYECVCQIKSFENFVSMLCALLWIEFFFVFEFNYFFEDSCLYWCVTIRLSRIFSCWEPECAVWLLGFIHSEKFVQVDGQVRITLRNHTKDCYIYWFIVLGLGQSDYRVLCNLCMVFD